MTNRRKTSLIDFVFTLSLFGVFTVCALLVVVIGANVYRSIVGTQDANAMTRTALAYVAEKIRQNDGAGQIRLGDVEGTPALVISDGTGAEAYATYIYVDEGALKELFLPASATPGLLAGQIITEVGGFSMEQVSDGLFSFSCTDAAGETLQLFVHAYGADVRTGA